MLSLATAASADSPPEQSAPLEPSITFVSGNMLGTANGTFHSWRITDLSVDLQNPGTGFVDVEVDIASVDTGIERRDKHLRTEDFFDVERYPTATAHVYDVAPDGRSDNGNPRYTAKFDLDIHGVKKTIAGRFEVVSMTPPTATGSLELNRRDFEVGGGYSSWNPMSVKEEVTIHFTASMPEIP
jgi:polyisoprenoid-binding protein YceI